MDGAILPLSILLFRSDSFDLNVALQDYFKGVRKEVEISQVITTGVYKVPYFLNKNITPPHDFSSPRIWSWVLVVKSSGSLSSRKE